LTDDFFIATLKVVFGKGVIKIEILDKKIYVRPIVVGCYGRDGCPVPNSREEKKESEARIAKAKKARLVK